MILGGELAVLQAPMFDGLSLDPFVPPRFTLEYGYPFEMFGFLPRVRVDPGAVIPRANIRFSASWKNTDIIWRSALASRVSPPCLYCGWLAPRLMAAGLRAP